MCVALILLANSFYKVYYWLFDLCEHALVSLLLLTTVFLFFLPVLFNLQSDEQRPLFTIAVLVSGVVGGLAVVITVVYLYRFCLKKRPPVTTTGKPEQKRDHVRSELTSQCRPLPLLIEEPSKEHNLESAMGRDSPFGSPTRIAEVFPLLTNESASYVQHAVSDGSYTNVNNKNAFLSVGEPPLRAHSAELLTVNQQQEIRRSSCDVPRGTGRQLPSTEGLEKQYEERQRRMSTFARSDAVQQMGYLPRKQNSSPLPSHPRIYERGHAHSRSWNPEITEHSSYLLKDNPTYQYYQTNEVYQEPMYIPTINEPPGASMYGNREFHRQAKSFDDRDSGRRRMSVDRRTVSVAERGLQRQATVQQVESPVGAACQSLWVARGHLEQLHNLGISDPSSASTSFDSNTDSQSTTTADVKRSKMEGDAERRRSKYKSLLVQRKFLSTAAVSSLDSTNSADSSPHEALFASSVDSYKSDLEQRRISLMNKHSGISMQHFDPVRPQIQEEERKIPGLTRDYSVDSKSDHLFREWSRVDPAYGERNPSDSRQNNRRMQRGYTEDAFTNRRQQLMSRQSSMGTPALVPLINYGRAYEG